jgi:ATP-binding cassette subfamily F protein 3
MLKFSNLSLHRGSRILFEAVNFNIRAGAKVGIIGANGSGKSSLLSLIRGELHADAGELDIPRGLNLAHVAQETPAVETPAIDYVMDGDIELRAAQCAIRQAETEADGVQLAQLHERLELMGGYTAHSRAACLLHGLGFRSGQEEIPVLHFSGGWRMRLNLAQALMCRSDLFLLDEPTNHLDLDAIIWLAGWLQAYPGTLLLISHDRDFLDQVTDHTMYIEQHSIRLTAGNYSAFEILRSAQLANQQATYAKQQRSITHMQQFVDRFKAKASKAKQAQSRLKALESMTLIAPAHVDSPFHFEFRPPEKLPNPLIKFEALTVGYAEQPVISNLSLSLAPGQRIGLLGRNGSGKSTLIKLMAGELKPSVGRCEYAKDLHLGYFAQHQVDQLDTEANSLQHLQRLDERATEQALRNYLGSFGFRNDRVEEAVAVFSGGEKARLVLALLVYQGPNLLLLDEPTNHLDLAMRYALTLALQNFSGAIVLVSHDRHLLRTVTDDFWLAHEGKCQPFNGDLDDYAVWLAEQRNRRDIKGTVTGEDTPTRKARRKQQARHRQRLQPLQQQARELEADIDRLSLERTELERCLADPALYQPDAKSRLQEALQRQVKIAKALAEAETAWLATWEDLEAAQAEST